MQSIAAVLIVSALLSFAAIQGASDALYSNVATLGTLPTRIPQRFGLAAYQLLDRIAPAAYVESTLAQAALNSGDLDAAQRYALRLGGSPVRDELLARIARERGQPVLALEYFLAAPDGDAIAAEVQARASRDPAAAYALERFLVNRLTLLGTHPDALAQASWQSGLLANRIAWVKVPGSAMQRMWLRQALRDFESAATLSPLSQRYVIAAANQADLLGDRVRAEELFRRATEIDPGSADAIAGLGVLAFERGDRSTAALYLKRARAIDARALMVRALERDLR
jgi:tetratricopeptide (TPR) repeat protein